MKRIVMVIFLLLTLPTMAGRALFARAHYEPGENIGVSSLGHETFAALHYGHEDRAAFGHYLVDIYNIGSCQGCNNGCFDTTDLKQQGADLLVPYSRFDHDSQRAFSRIRVGEYDEESPPG